MPSARQIARIDALGQRIATLSFRNIWDDALEELRTSFRAEGALAYRLCRVPPASWEFEFLHSALSPDPEARLALGAFTRFMTSASKPWVAYDPARPARAQRNRALSERDLSRGTGTKSRLAELYREMGGPWRNPDQVRVLICDGSRLLGWVGVVSKSRFSPESKGLLQRVVPALRSRLEFDDLVRDRDRAHQSLDAALAAIDVPCLLLDRFGRVEHANEPARRLQLSRADLFEAARQAPKRPDARFQVRPVAARGLPPSVLVTFCPSSTLERREQLLKRWRLTPRQHAVLELVVEGLSNKQIGARLGIGEGTVELHMTAIFRKSQVGSRAELVSRYWSAP